MATLDIERLVEDWKAMKIKPVTLKIVFDYHGEADAPELMKIPTNNKKWQTLKANLLPMEGTIERITLLDANGEMITAHDRSIEQDNTSQAHRLQPVQASITEKKVRHVVTELEISVDQILRAQNNNWEHMTNMFDKVVQSQIDFTESALGIFADISSTLTNRIISLEDSNSTLTQTFRELSTRAMEAENIANQGDGMLNNLVGQAMPAIVNSMMSNQSPPQQGQQSPQQGQQSPQQGEPDMLENIMNMVNNMPDSVKEKLAEKVFNIEAVTEPSTITPGDK